MLKNDHEIPVQERERFRELDKKHYKEEDFEEKKQQKRVGRYRIRNKQKGAKK